MDRFQQFLAWYLGLKAPGPGEGTQWRLDWRLPGPAWLFVVGSVALIVLVAWIYRRDGEALRSRQRLVLIGLRLSVLALVLGMLTELSLTVERTGLPSVAVMIDTSASMSLQDQYPPNSQGAEMAKAISLQPGRDAHRLALTQEILSRQGGQFLHALQDEHQVRLYQFAETAAMLESGDLDDQNSPTSAAPRDATAIDPSGASAPPQSSPKLPPFEAALAEVAALRPEGDQTRPAPR